MLPGDRNFGFVEGVFLKEENLHQDNYAFETRTDKRQNANGK